MTTAAAGVIPEFTMRDRLRKARETTGMDQGNFAEAIGVSRATVSNYEASDRRPREVVLRAWALATGVPLEWLKTGNAPRPVGPDEGQLCAARDSNPEPADMGNGAVVLGFPSAPSDLDRVA